MTPKKHLKIFVIITAISVGMSILAEETYVLLTHSGSLFEYRLGHITFGDFLVTPFFTLPGIIVGLSGTALSFTRLSGARTAMIASGAGIAYATFWYSLLYVKGVTVYVF